MIEKIVSGGQTGVDRAALDIAILFNISHGGWCPKGRLAEDGAIDAKYHLKETNSNDYAERTRQNVIDSDGTLVLVPGIPINTNDGTQLTVDEAIKEKKPHKLFDLSNEKLLDEIIDWVSENNLKVLNIAGPRESQSPMIYSKALSMLKKLLNELSVTNSNLPKARL